MKVGQRGKIIKLTSIGCEPHGEWPVLTADETWVDEGNFTIVEVHSDCIVINFDYGHRDAENVDGDLIDWIVHEEEYDNIVVTN